MLKSLLSSLSFLSSIIYICIGLYILNINKKSRINKTFLALCTSYSIWSLAYGFAYISNNDAVFSFWNKISAVGWCSFSGIALYLVLLLTDSILISYKLFKFIIFIPAIVFFIMAEFLFGPSIKTPQFVEKIFYSGDFIYNFSYLLISITVICFWGIKSKKIREKKQAKILVITSILPFILNLLTQTILPLFGIQYPLMGQIYSIIMILGVYVVISKYKFLKLSNTIIMEQIMEEMMDLTILINSEGSIINVNKHTLNLLGYMKDELLNKPIDIISEDNRFIEMYNSKLGKESILKLNNISILKKGGETIPVNLSCTPLFDTKINDLIGVLFVLQDIRVIKELEIEIIERKRVEEKLIQANKEIEKINIELQQKNIVLHDKSIRDSLTKLYNHQYCIEILENEVGKARLQGLDLCVMMLDIDFFKKVNDTYGHQFGDEAILLISKILVRNVRNTDFVGRYGGEEYIIILPGIDDQGANNIAHRIKQDVENYKFKNGCKITISIGVKQMENEDSTLLIKKADELLYNAKKYGRNRVECGSSAYSNIRNM